MEVLGRKRNAEFFDRVADNLRKVLERTKRQKTEGEENEKKALGEYVCDISIVGEDILETPLGDIEIGVGAEDFDVSSICSIDTFETLFDDYDREFELGECDVEKVVYENNVDDVDEEIVKLLL